MLWVQKREDQDPNRDPIRKFRIRIHEKTNNGSKQNRNTAERRDLVLIFRHSPNQCSNLY